MAWEANIRKQSSAELHTACVTNFAFRALALGEAPPLNGNLLSRSDVERTVRYAHLAQASLHETAKRIAESMAADSL